MHDEPINIDADPLNADWLRVLSIGRKLDAMEDVFQLRRWIGELGMEPETFLQLPAVKHGHRDHPLVQELRKGAGEDP